MTESKGPDLIVSRLFENELYVFWVERRKTSRSQRCQAAACKLPRNNHGIAKSKISATLDYNVE